jgi:5-formyltetrahydrofolate cyclo-ligase
MSVDDMAGSKARLRTGLNSWRTQFAVHLADNPAERERLQQDFAQRLRQICEQKNAKRIACYLPFGGEPDTSVFNKWALDARLELLLPVANPDSTLHWVAFDGVTTTASIFGFAEPHGQPVALEPVDLIIVPALAIDQRGNRLGKGKGYYDRALAQTSAPVVAVVYEHELLEVLPAEKHDRRVDYVVTPSQTLRLESDRDFSG